MCVSTELPSVISHWLMCCSSTFGHLILNHVAPEDLYSFIFSISWSFTLADVFANSFQFFSLVFLILLNFVLSVLQKCLRICSSFCMISWDFSALKNSSNFVSSENSVSTLFLSKKKKKLLVRMLYRMGPKLILEE